MLFDFILRAPLPGPAKDQVQVGSKLVAVVFVRNLRARRYLLRLRPDGVARVTVPNGGTIKFAKEFAQRNTAWLEREWHRRQQQIAKPLGWYAGTEVFFRGELTRLEIIDGTAYLGSERLAVTDAGGDVRRIIEQHLWRLAVQELPGRVTDLAARHQLSVKQITVRNQRTRWGSCSRRGTISLNWRLVQTPLFVRDYIILHELAHLRHMNHSPRYWQEVERLCPDYEAAERWLRTHARLLR